MSNAHAQTEETTCPQEILMQKFIKPLIFQRDWVHRVVVSIKYDAGELENSQSISLDCTVPDFPSWRATNICLSGDGSTELTWAASRTKDDDQVIVPVAMLKKGIINKLDVTFEGKSLSVLTTSQNRSLTFEIIRSSLSRLSLDATQIEQAMADVTCIYEQRPEGSVDQGSADATQNILEIIESSQIIDEERSRTLSDFILLLQTHYLLFVLVPKSCVKKRVILKYKISGDASNKVTDPARKRLFTPLVADYELDLWWNKSNHHVDVSYPTELMISSVVLSSESENFVIERPQVHRYHTNVPAELVDQFLGKKLYFKVVPAVQSLRRWNAWLSILFALGYSAGLFIQICATKNFGLDDASLRSAATVVLLLPALLVSWLARSNEHPFVAAAFSQLRLVFLLQALILYFSSATLVLHVGGWLWTLSWYAIYCAAAVVSIYAAILHWVVLKEKQSRTKHYFSRC